MKYIKTETLDGKVCLVYEITEQDLSGKVWLWKDYGIPVEVTQEGEQVVTEFKNVQVTEWMILCSSCRERLWTSRILISPSLSRKTSRPTGVGR